MINKEIEVIKLEFNKWLMDNPEIKDHHLKNKTRSGLPFGYGIVCYILYDMKGQISSNGIKPRKMKEIIEFFHLEEDFLFDGEKWELL